MFTVGSGPQPSWYDFSVQESVPQLFLCGTIYTVEELLRLWYHFIIDIRQQAHILLLLSFPTINFYISSEKVSLVFYYGVLIMHRVLAMPLFKLLGDIYSVIGHINEATRSTAHTTDLEDR